jgi:hypothetical protein
MSNQKDKYCMKYVSSDGMKRNIFDNLCSYFSCWIITTKSGHYQATEQKLINSRSSELNLAMMILEICNWRSIDNIYDSMAFDPQYLFVTHEMFHINCVTQFLIQEMFRPDLFAFCCFIDF